MKGLVQVPVLIFLFFVSENQKNDENSLFRLILIRIPGKAVEHVFLYKIVGNQCRVHVRHELR